MRHVLAALVGAFAVWAAPIAAQETRIGEEGFESPPASLGQMDWLIGQWEGDGIGGAPAMESWLPPTGATMVGTFIQQSDEGAIQFTEHLYLMEEEGTLILRLKHFQADLTAWEEKEEMVTFRLLAMEPCAAYFNALTLRCADADQPGKGLVAAVRMQSGAELLFRFDRAAPYTLARPTSCADVVTTVEINKCYAQRLSRSETKRGDYLRAALARHADRPELVEKITAADAVFVRYRDAECDAVYEDWKDGTIRGVKSLACLIKITDKRTRTIWQNWLTYPDSTPADLPEPEATR